MDLSSLSEESLVSAAAAAAAATKKRNTNGRKSSTMMMTMHHHRRKRHLQTNKRRRRFCASPLIILYYTALNSIIILLLSSRRVDCLSITTFNILASVHRSMPCPSEYVAGVGVDNDLIWTDQHDWRESDKAEWWKPRAEQLAKYIADELSFSDVILLQEWWNNPEFEDIFKKHLDDKYVIKSEKRPGFQWTTTSNNNNKKQPREDGMACLVKRQGQLELISSTPVNTSLLGCRDKIGQIIHCKEKTGDHRDVLIGNTHLSFPGGPCKIQASRRQAYEAHFVARAISRKGRQLSYKNENNDDSSKQHLELMVGDFNSNSCDMAAKTMESSPYNFVNCMSAVAEQALSASIGGVINLGVTHRNHLGEDVSVDHIMARFIDHTTSSSSSQQKKEQQQSSDNIIRKASRNNQKKKNDIIEPLRRMGILTRFLDPTNHHSSSTTLKKEISDKNNIRKAASNHQENNNDIIEPLRRMGYFDSKGTRLVSCRKHDIQLEGSQIMSDHRPVTADLHWPSSTSTSFINDAATAAMNHNHIHHQHHNAQVYHHQYYDVHNATLHPLESPWNS